MTSTIEIRLTLSADEPNSVSYADTLEGLDAIWYRFSADRGDGVQLWATPDGFEHLARLFLKLARGKKVPGHHSHDPLEYGEPDDDQGPELTIDVVDAPPNV